MPPRSWSAFHVAGCPPCIAVPADRAWQLPACHEGGRAQLEGILACDCVSACDHISACDHVEVTTRLSAQNLGAGSSGTGGPATDRRFVLTAADWEAPAARQLREDQQAELRRIYGGDTEPGVKPSASDVTVFVLAWEVPDGAQLADAVARTDALAVGCGGLRPLDATSAEIKRMYVRPTHRRRGLSRQILDELEFRARSQGWFRLRLETGPAQIAAIGLYEAAGYRKIPNFGAYQGHAASLCFEKALDQDRAPAAPGKPAGNAES